MLHANDAGAPYCVLVGVLMTGFAKHLKNKSFGGVTVGDTQLLCCCLQMISDVCRGGGRITEDDRST